MLLSTVAIFVAVIVYVRVVGLRSFSKMSGFDFAMTVAIGSVMASVAVSPSVTLANGAIGLAGFFGTQFVIARLRRRTRAARIVDNSPRLLMEGDAFIEDNMRAARITRPDVMAKLREANVLDPATVRAVVLETTGDMSILHGRDELDRRLLEGVRGAERSGPEEADHGPSSGSTSRA